MASREQTKSVTPTEMSWEDSNESLTASTASLQQQQQEHLSNTSPIASTGCAHARAQARARARAGPGLLLFPGTAQRPELANLMSQSQQRRATDAKAKAAANANEEHVVINQRKPNSVRSFRRPPLWQPRPERSDTSRTERTSQKEAVAACVGKAQAFIIEFLLGSSIHGFIYLAKRGLNLVER